MSQTPGRLASRPSGRLARLSIAATAGGRYGQALLLALLIFLLPLLPFAAAATTPAGTAIDNTATASFQVGVGGTLQRPSNQVRVVTVEVRTPSTLEFLKVADRGGEPLVVPVTEFSPSGDGAQPFSVLPSPTPFGGTQPVDLQAVPLLPGDLFHQGEPLFLRLTDRDQNRDPAAVESIVLTISVPQTGDQEVLRLYESAPDTGVFLGYLPTGNGGNTTFNGVLSVVEGGDILGRYVDAVDGTDFSLSAALVDPFGVAFDIRTGLPVNGTTVTLVNALTDLPAEVRGDDGVSLFQNPIITGGTATDSSGRTYVFAPGRYRFPFVPPGTYRLVVTPPDGYGAPSIVTNSDLQALPGSTLFAIVPGSRGESFTVNPGPALRIDIPLPPIAGQMWVQKSAGKEQVSIGDFVPYRLQIGGPGELEPDVVLVDRLPPGFRYRKGSARLDGQPAGDPEIAADGRTLTFRLGDLAAGASREIRYVAEVAAGARPGEAVNVAQASSASGLVSNEARAAVQVVEAFFRDITTIAGRVVAGACGTEGAGLPGARIYLEDGTYVVTDERGMYHFEGVRPGSHVVQLDLDSLPPWHEVIPCEANSRFAGRAYSQFVDLQGGTLWHADFHVDLRPKAKGEVAIELNSRLDGDEVGFAIPIAVGGVPVRNLRLAVILPPEATYVAGTSALAGAPLADPQVAGANLIYRLGDFPAGGASEISFRCRIAAGTPGELPTRAVLTFDSPTEKNQRTPMAENLLRQQIETSREALPEFTVRPHFPTLGAELSVEDKAELDRLAEGIRALNAANLTLHAIGHTDNVRIAPHNRHLYADNFALSEARARSVARYLGEALGLPPERIAISGVADTMPIAVNDTAVGRALNRRVEVRVKCEQLREQATLSALKDRSGVQRTETTGLRPGEPTSVAGATPAAPQPADAMPEFDKRWVESAAPGLEWLWPRPEYNPPIPSLKVAIKHNPKEKVSLLLGGKEVNPLTFEGTVQNGAGSVAVSLWRGIGIGEGDNRLELVVTNAAGETSRLVRIVHYSGPPVKVVLAPAQSQLLADGKTEPVIAVLFTDKDGFPVREGVVGDFAIDPPYAARTNKVAVARVVDSRSTPAQFQVGADGIALIRLEPTTRSGEAVLHFKLAEQDYEIRSWLKPAAREWILVGLAEGTAGYNTISGNMEALPSGLEDNLYNDGRVAFFAKGMIKGKWLLTAAYDSDKPKRQDESLFQTIDPDAYYPLYGDATVQGYEAASARKLYVKLEREQFYAMFGDYDTGLTVTELSRYSRSFNGLKAEMDSGDFTFNVFATDTAQAFIKDEIRGDGTSGLYRLSRKDIVLNSEKIVIETRDRFRSEVILSSRPLARHIDYNIDYQAGTLFFREPIPSRDEGFNPVYIVVDYEARDSAEQAWTYGGRGAVRLFDRQVETGATVIHEGGTGREGNLYGLDARWEITPETELRAEVATSDREDAGDRQDGSAWLAELAHRTPLIDGRVYYREVEPGFGLGQQRGSEEGTRKFGVEGAYRLAQKLQLEGEAYRQVNLETDAKREVAEAALRLLEKRYTARFGLRQANDTLGDGTAQRSTQLLLGGSWVATPRLTLRAEHEQALAGRDASRDFPTRTLLGADFRLTQNVTLFAEQEFTQGENRETSGTRAGMKASVWKGGEFNSALERQVAENGARLFALYGLRQTWQLNQHWSVDGSLDRSDTLSEPDDTPLDEDVPAASGEQEDFTAVSLGATYKLEKWSWANRVEYRTADSEDKWGLFSGLSGEVRPGLGVSARTQIFVTEAASGARTTDTDINFGFVYRPFASRWTVLDRLDLLFDRERQAAGGGFNNWRVVNNLNANYRPNGWTQISLLYGAKYIEENIDGENYDGFTDLIGLEGRYDLTDRWDVGVRGSVLHSWASDLLDYSAGVSLGCNLVKNAWVSLGYNFLGFQDEDFSRADFTAQGPFLRFRFKFDQNSVREALNGLN